MMYPNLVALSQRCTLVLGSGSPRRLQLLGETGATFTRIIPSIEESPLPGEAPYVYAARLAEEKALEVAKLVSSTSVVIGCDTIVVLGDHILEKPVDRQHAFEILSRLSGQAHTVCTAVAFAKPDRLVVSGYELTRVYFNAVTADQIWQYIDSGEPMDKAGAYGIQGMGSFLVDRIEGNLDTVVGLPRTLMEGLAREVLAIV